MNRAFALITVAILGLSATVAFGQHPPVADGPGGEPNLSDLLENQWGLVLDRDLRNPIRPRNGSAALFKRVDPNKPVIFKPIIALGLETMTRGGWYGLDLKPLLNSDTPPPDPIANRKELWRYAYKPSEEEMAKLPLPSPPLQTEDVKAHPGNAASHCKFDPGDSLIGFWVSNDNFPDEVVLTDVEHTRRLNERFADQPYKVMIYPNVDAKTRRMIPNSYILTWEYSTNDDFQDVVTVVENVRLLPGVQEIPGVVKADASMKRLADGFAFTEGPAWDRDEKALYFTDIPNEHIIRYADGESQVAVEKSQRANGLMFDKEGNLIACEHGGRRLSIRSGPRKGAKTLTATYDFKRLNSPNDLWLDAHGGIYFTDPRYGQRETMQMEIEGVYYLDRDGTLTRIIDDLVRPNGIALSPDGKVLYVLDNGTNELFRYAVKSPGRIAKGTRIAHVLGPDGMTVDREGRLYVTTREGVVVLAADGAWLGHLSVREVPSNCTFGGADLATLFVTARNGLYAIPTQTRGWHVHLDSAPTAANGASSGFSGAGPVDPE